MLNSQSPRTALYFVFITLHCGRSNIFSTRGHGRDCQTAKPPQSYTGPLGDRDTGRLLPFATRARRKLEDLTDLRAHSAAARHYGSAERRQFSVPSYGSAARAANTS